MRPYCCPVCLGHGRVCGGFYNCVPGGTPISTNTSETCKSCNGSGIIWGANDTQETYAIKNETIRYGGLNTIHLTNLLNIEVDKKTGKVVSVWFRCLALPFDVTEVDRDRANEMGSMYSTGHIPKIEAIEVTQ
jgi:hypothetical protein